MFLAFKPSKKKLSPLPPYNNGRSHTVSIASTRGTKRKRSPSRSPVRETVGVEEVPPTGGSEEVSVETTHARERRDSGSPRRVRNNRKTEVATLKRDNIANKGNHVILVLELY